eukprot:TRINITY_DN885_c0_g1_i5.p1 TRINITY_DN885_c0_g1~~TRINITY_DN885_c0_g1_i5.p1  ORF type:complete len:668 (-),score=135.66 TRINITY_DN885_c0_g1_i5:58-2061(-)
MAATTTTSEHNASPTLAYSAELVCPEEEAHASSAARDPFDPAQTMWDLWSNAVAAYPDNECFGTRHFEPPDHYGSYEWSSYVQVNAAVERLAAALVAAGTKSRGTVAVFAQNCPEYVITEYAAFRQSMIVVPLYATFGLEAVAFIMEQAETATVVCDPASLQKLAECVQMHPCPHLKRVVVTGSAVPCEIPSVECITWNAFLDTAKNSPVEPVLPSAEDVCTIFYTSGTVGMPKGAMLTHRNIYYSAYAIATSVHFSLLKDPHPTHISYLPLAHVYECTFMSAVLRSGGRVGFFSGSVARLFEDIEVLGPHFVLGVPRVWKKFSDKVTQTVNEAGFLQRTVFAWAQYYKTQARLGDYSTWVDWDGLVFNKIKAKFGPNIKMLVSAAAPLDPQLQEWLRTCVGVNVFQGYGLTESAAGVMIQTAAVRCPSDSVGFPVVGTRVRLADVPDMGYLTSGNPPRGEIQMQGPAIFSGYFKEPELTKEALLSGGWLATGDIGQLNADGSLTVIDRKKNIFKLSQGEYVAVERIECVYGRVPCINQVWVWGDSTESFLVAVVVPDFPQLIAVMKADPAANTALSAIDVSSEAAVCALPVAERIVLDALTSEARNNHLTGFEVVKGVLLEHEAFSLENGLLTPTHKLKRNVLKAKYGARLAATRESVKAREQAAH